MILVSIKKVGAKRNMIGKMNTVKSGTYFHTFALLKKVPNLIPYENFFSLRDPRISTSFCFEALKSTKISLCEPVSSQKYENGYRTKICNFTVLLTFEKMY